MSQPPQDNAMSGFGPNEWLVDEMYDHYREDPTSVDEAWQELFKDREKHSKPRPSQNGAGSASAPPSSSSSSSSSATATAKPQAETKPAPKRDSGSVKGTSSSDSPAGSAPPAKT
ncbi:MAG: hypothetical protein ABJA81_12620, partial [Nocardioidaceae bacterium]